MMSTLGLQIYFWPLVTLNFDLLTPQLIIMCRCHVDRSTAPLGIEIGSIADHVDNFDDGRTATRERPNL